MKIALYLALFLCAMLILIGLAMLGSDCSLIYPVVYLTAGGSLGTLCVDLLKEE